MDADLERQPFAGLPNFDPMDPAQLANPYPTYADLRRDRPVFYDPKLDLWVVSRYADIVASVKQSDVFSSSGALTPAGKFLPSVEAVFAGGIGPVKALTEIDGPDHARIRAVLNRAFTPKRIVNMEARVRAIAEDLIDQFASDGKAELTAQFASKMPGLVICDLLGVPLSDFPLLKKWTDDWVKLMSVNIAEEEQIRCAHSLVEYQRYMHEQLLDRQKNPREDILTVMLPPELGGAAALSVNEAVSNGMTFFAAGYEQTANMIMNAVVTLFGHREQYDRLSADPSLLERAVEEILRYAGSVKGIFRVTTRPVELGGETIPADARVFLLYCSANHDEKHFDNPEVFDIDRQLARDHMTFARGIHICAGAALARMEVRVAIELLQRRLPNLRPAAGVAPPQRLEHLWISGYTTLPVEWDRN
jgi:cytochrome P450